MKEVKTKTIASTPKIIAQVPVITFVKYSTAITKAMIMRAALSTVPIFAFMSIYFDFGKVGYYLRQVLQQKLHKLPVSTPLLSYLFFLVSFSYLFSSFSHILPSSSVYYIGKATTLQNTFSLTATITAATKNYYDFLVF